MLSFFFFFLNFFFSCLILFRHFGFADEGGGEVREASVPLRRNIMSFPSSRERKNERGKDGRRKFVGYGILFSGELPAGFLASRAKCEYRI